MKTTSAQNQNSGSPSASDTGATASGSLLRGLQVLDVLRQAHSNLSLSDISAETGLDASTVHRLLQTLMESGYAVRDGVQKRYLPGPRALSPLSLFHPLTQLRREAGSTLQALEEVTRRTATLVLFIGHERLVVDFFQGSSPLSPYYESWLKSPLHGSASGKILLAWMAEPAREQILGAGPYEAHTRKTITDPVALAHVLDQVLAQGHVTARDDFHEGQTAIGVPLIHPAEARPLGCLVLTLPSNSAPTEAEMLLLPQLKSAAKLLLNGAPSLQIFRQWNARGIFSRIPANLAMA